MQVFISYKSEHRDFARQVKNAIESWGLGTWFDQDNIPKGAYFRSEIQKGLESSDIVLGIATSEALESREVQAEWDFAFSEGRRFVLFLLHELTLPYHLRGVQYIDATKNPELGIQQLEQALRTGEIVQTKPDAPPQTQSKALNKTQLDNRSAMLEKVQQYWVEGVLYNALGESGSLSIGLSSSPHAVLKHRLYDDYEFPENALDIHKLFKDLQRELLILGAPGSGKTILLLQLTEKLLEEAHKDENLPIPAFFNLSSWAAKRKSLRDWLIEELNFKYQIPKRIAKKWIEHEKLLLLLDGLDEVAEEHRDDCLSAINAFRAEYKSVDVAICSRITEYEALTNKLDLQGAITLQPLSREQVQDYLADDRYSSLREEMTKDIFLARMARIPFLLNTMAYAYMDANSVMLALNTNEKRTTKLFETYVEKRIQNDMSQAGYTPNQTRRYLYWLASDMVSRGETTFAIESILPMSIRGWKSHLVFHVIFTLGLILTINVLVFFASYTNIATIFANTVFGALISIIYFLASAHVNARGIERLVSFIISGSVVSVVSLLLGDLIGLQLGDPTSAFMLVVFLGASVGLALSFGYQTLNPRFFRLSWRSLGLLLFGGAVLVFIPIVSCLLLPLFIVNMIFRENSTGGVLREPNGGLRRMIIFSGVVWLLLFAMISYGVLVSNPSDPFAFWVFSLFSTLFWLIFGGHVILRHLATRLVLGWQGNIPKWRYDKFLDHAANDLHILRKVGGSYIFRHRYLLEYFAGRELK